MHKVRDGIVAERASLLVMVMLVTNGRLSTVGRPDIGWPPMKLHEKPKMSFEILIMLMSVSLETNKPVSVDVQAAGNVAGQVPLRSL